MKPHLMMSYLYYFAAISTVVTIAEILKNTGFAVEKSKSNIGLFIFYDIPLCPMSMLLKFTVGLFNLNHTFFRDYDIYC